MEVNGKKVKCYESVFVIAETASSHEGRVNCARKMADAVAMTNVDAIKFQLLNADSLLVPDHHKYNAFKELQFTDEEWFEIIDYSRSIGLLVIAEVFDEKSFELAEQNNISVYKIPSSDLNNPFLVPRVAATMKTLILSVGGATEEEINKAVRMCEAAGNRNLILMHGFQSFPTKIEDANLKIIEALSEKYPYHIGFADHTDAKLEMSRLLPLVAIGYGASVIEKHITLDRSLKGRDYHSALNPDEFSHLVCLIREIERSYGSFDLGQSDAEVEYRNLMKKKVVAKRDIWRGEVITAHDICFKRSDEDGIFAHQYEKILERSRRFIAKNSIIKEEDVR